MVENSLGHQFVQHFTHGREQADRSIGPRVTRIFTRFVQEYQLRLFPRARKMTYIQTPVEQGYKKSRTFAIDSFQDFVLNIIETRRFPTL
ncbi:unnamed protein product [Larinioides sclopetarius]|uniref:Uncharacterized protein n=1 Tax=Larinioides sclopetarius TaxID=280406 RepID=A0AAV2B2I7_9ARAC